MTERGHHTFTEITSQPEVWAKTIEGFAAANEDLLQAWNQFQPRQVIFIGCGSTYYLSVTAATLFQEATGIPAQSAPSSELLLNPDRYLSDPLATLLVTISRSGTTTETIKALEQYRRHSGQMAWTITCYPDSPLAEGSDLVLAAPAAQEESIAQTRSFGAMLLLVQLAVATLAGKEEMDVVDRLPEIGRQILNDAAELASVLGPRLDFDRVYFLGSGNQYGVANEGMLKMTEMSLTFSNAFHFMEYRHGPMSMATEEALIVGLISSEQGIHEIQVLREMMALGAKTLAINASELASGADYEIRLPAGLPAWALPVLYLPPLQLLAYQRSMAKGLDPDNPRNLTAVITLDISVS